MRAERALVEQLKSGVAARTLLIGIAAATRCSAQHAPRVRWPSGCAPMPRSSRCSTATSRAFAAVGRWVFEHRYLLSPAVDARRFSAEGLREAIDDTLSLLGTPAGALVKPLLDRDPPARRSASPRARCRAAAAHARRHLGVARRRRAPC